ncbi:hypothetical protein L7F22_021368 [Adiantum nelumboides]|nr:hypothetical protein [Adiantum nelumboides]
MQEKLGATASRRGKLAAVAAPTISSLNRVRSPALTVSSSSPSTSRRAPSTRSHQDHPTSQQEKTSNGRPLSATVPGSKHPLSHTSAIPCLSNVINSQARSPNSDEHSLSQVSLDHNMTSSDTKSASRMRKSFSDKPNYPSINTRKASKEAKSTEVHPRHRPAPLPQPKKVIKDADLPAASRRASHNSSEVNHGNKERSISKDQLSVQPSNKIRREKFGVRGRRRGYHVTDLPLRRRPLTYRGQGSKRDVQLRRKSFDTITTSYPLLNLEEYLKQRGPGRENAAVIVEDMESPNSHLGWLQKSSLMVKNRRLVFLGESPSQLVDSSLQDQQLLAKFSVHTYVSADEADDPANQFSLGKTGYNMPQKLPANHRTSKNESLLHYAGSCFNVSRRRVGGRRSQVAYMYSSERSFSSFGSDTEMAPLMTEPEPFHEFSDDQSASSVASVEQYGGELTYHGYKDIHSHNGELTFNAHKDILTNEASSIIQGLAVKKPRDMACKNRSISQKYRPKAFKDLLGQKIVAESLSNAILRSKIAPVYLFHGPRGTGKTTAAKIFTCAMNCLSTEELRPCGLCKECMSFNAGTNYDVKEVDAAGNSEIESMKIMLKHLCLPPSVSQYKVFIMDDCHMLTIEAWNALLKSLEEPPEYVVFILITTNLEQLPRAAISRCQKFMFSRVKDADIVFRLKKLAQQERVEIDGDALQFIAAQSDGSLRDAEMMLDQLSLLGKKVTLGIVREMVGLIPEDELINLLEMAFSMDTVNTVNTIRDLMGSGVEPLALASQLATLITDILAGRCQLAKYPGMKVRKDQQDKLQQALKVLSDLEKQLRSCSDGTTWLTAAFLQLASNNSHPSSSRGTSIAQSPATVLNASERDTLNFDGAGRRYSWGGKEKWDSHEPLQLDDQREHSLCENSSGPYMDNRIYPCDHSPQSVTSFNEKAVCKLPGRTHNDDCSTLSPRSVNEIWQKVVHGNSSDVLKQLLQESKLVSLCIAEGFAIAHLEFRSRELKNMAERVKQNISNAFQIALLCTVKVEISLSPSHGHGDFACGGADHLTVTHSEHHSKHMLLDHETEYWQERAGARGVSFRKSSFRNMEFASSSPRYHEVEHRKAMQGIDGEVRTYSKSNADTSLQNLQVYKGPGESMHHDGTAGGYVSEHKKSKEQRNSFDDPRFSASLRWSDTREDMEYSSDSEIDGSYAPGLLCWKGTRMKDERGKRHVLRRRRARFLLRLVPCAKEEEGKK